MKLEADLSNDMLLRLCLMRRGLALDQCNVLDYAKHDAWVEKILDIRLESPPDGYQRVTLQQIVNADRKLFLKLAELTRSGIQITAKGRPVDLVFEQAVNHPDVLHLLQPMPTAKGSSSTSAPNQNAAAGQLDQGLTRDPRKARAKWERLKVLSPSRCLKGWRMESLGHAVEMRFALTTI